MTFNTVASTFVGSEQEPGPVLVCVEVINNVSVALDVTLSVSGKESKCRDHYSRRSITIFTHTLKDYKYNCISVSHSHPQLLTISFFIKMLLTPL